jgi:ABC-type transport system involved in multi-copper enzyme maturation permease subunit
VVAGRRTRHVWQEEPPSKTQLWWEKILFTPRFWLSFFRRWMSRQIERNPIGWLERRRWSGRLMTWTWLAVVISIYSIVLRERNFFRGVDDLQNAIAWLLAGCIAISAAGSFRRERETGVLELLLISPLNEAQIISGRLRGLWGQFLPAFATLFVLWIYLNSFLERSHPETILFHLSTFLSLPMIGLYFSLRCRNFLTALLLTLSAGLLLPMILAAMWNPNGVRASEAAACVQVITAYFLATALYRRLKNRSFRYVHGSRA